MRAYHGTSSKVLEAILLGRKTKPRRVFIESNVSLGGTYVTERRNLAEVYAEQAARVLGGRPIVLELDLDEAELQPDEDWVVDAAEGRDEPPTRIQKFLDDVFVGYLGEGFSLSDHYTKRYTKLNAKHRVTWRDSWQWRGTARLPRPLRASDIRSESAAS